MDRDKVEVGGVARIAREHVMKVGTGWKKGIGGEVVVISLRTIRDCDCEIRG